jgi:broad specificity phosphatase PhoE
MHEAARSLHQEVFDLVVASTLQRSWEGAWIVAGGAPVRLEKDFREIDFGRWEGLTAREIEVRDPVLYREWQSNPDFDFPGGEVRAEYRDRVLRGLGRIEKSGACSALLVVHKGTIRTISQHLLGTPLAQGEPPLGGIVQLSRGPDGTWYQGRHGSNPAGVE